MSRSPRFYSDEDLKETVQTLERGGVILYPTDTVWGVGCDAQNDDAVREVFALKKRSDAKALISLVPNVEALLALVPNIPDMARSLIELITDPVTIIYPEVQNISPLLKAKDGSAGIRIVQDPFCQAVTKLLGRPIVSTSANLSGQPTPKNFQEIVPEVIRGSDYIVKYRQEDMSERTPSKIFKINRDGTFEMIR